MTPEDIAALPYRPCVGVVLANDEGKIFAGQRIDAKDLGTDATAWQMPQGGVDEGEAPRDAALRELLEETGVTPDLVEVEAEHPDALRYDLPEELVASGKIWKGRYKGQEQRWYLMRFKGTDDQIDIETEHPEFSEWTWIDPDEMVARIVPFKRDIYRAVMDAFRDRL
ncbi:MAG: RNA pyrophosphohydrolase [Maritimibacter harenae]|jgi:putative (di)nucleoside polyphosphate hydrolase|uniref:RNA pyrophosphohydrolase n=1 Tax=Maritimibacter harenae TaxID=2606218 RepID=A0A845M7M2_9RHOB|nr:RNA pyrophosphohydrolase [Maritimibacter harenae]MZR15322.1 RNA pyrophosphohydrolase [Maritimibacter harenae]